MNAIEKAKQNLTESKVSERWKDVYYWVAFLDGAKAEKELTESAIVAKLAEMTDDEVRELSNAAQSASRWLDIYLHYRRHNDAAERKPAKVVWAEGYGGGYPACPNCGEPAYEVDRCVFCGQKFI